MDRERARIKLIKKRLEKDFKVSKLKEQINSVEKTFNDSLEIDVILLRSELLVLASRIKILEDKCEVGVRRSDE